MKLFIGCMCEQGCILLSGHQSDSHDHSLTGLQKTCTEFGLSSSFYNCRNGHQVLPADTDRGTHKALTKKETTNQYSCKLQLQMLHTVTKQTNSIFLYKEHLNLRFSHRLIHTDPVQEDTQCPCQNS